MLYQNLFISSFDGADMYQHIHRGFPLSKNHKGMIPESLELRKLLKENIRVVKSTTGKMYTPDIINLKFKKNVKSAKGLIKKYEDMKRKLGADDIAFSNDLDVKIEEAKQHFNDWQEIKANYLRKFFYENGFTLRERHKKTGEIISETHYRVYKRTSSKSRTGQVLFIREDLYDTMIAWSRMGLPFADNDVDLAGLLAYESLVASGLQSGDDGYIKIHPKNILMHKDLYSSFTEECNVIRFDNTSGSLRNYVEPYLVENNIFDGEGLLDSSLFAGRKGMKLLRNHMFKCCVFNTNIQEFLKDHCPAGVKFENWKLEDMYGNEIAAKDVLMICTDSSLKALKFCKDLGMTDSEMYSHWKAKVKEDGCIFGVCKSEKESKRGSDEEGNVLQQTTYQFLNSLPASAEDIMNLAKAEKDFIMGLKNDDKSFLDYALRQATEININEMMVEIAKGNEDFMATKYFKDFRARNINHYVEHVKKGKIRLRGDYCVMLSNPVELLHYAIGKFGNVPREELQPHKESLQGYEIQTLLFKDNEELVAFRNPHTSGSNVGVHINVKKEVIDKYLNLTPNIVVVNSIKTNSMNIYSGADYDSDTICITKNDIILKLARRCKKEYRVCINAVEADKIKKTPTAANMAEVDNILSKSQNSIGTCTNTAQLILSNYWDKLNSGSREDLSLLMDRVAIATVLQGLTIDLCKKMFPFNVDNELRALGKGIDLKKKKPMFFKYISKDEDIKNMKNGEYLKLEEYQTPMDFLFKEFDSLPKAKEKPVKCLTDCFRFQHKDRKKEIDRKQQKKVAELLKELNRKIKGNLSIKADDDDTKEELARELHDIITIYGRQLGRLKINAATMSYLVEYLLKNDLMNMTILNALYKTHKATLKRLLRTTCQRKEQAV